MNILEKIVAKKKEEVAFRKKTFPVASLTNMESFSHECYPLVGFLRDPSRSSIIAEFKRKSPSRGWINKNANAERETRGYASFGASALSVLTDGPFFGGGLDDLTRARQNGLPILRKDFIIDDYQIIESKAYGADVILLIAACLEKKQIRDLTHTAKNMGLNVLLELHSADELDKICDGVDVVGINNRDLKTFQVNIQNSIAMAKQIPSKCKISESGIEDIETVNILKAEGFDGFLIGEKFMREKIPAIAFKNFIRGKV